ncbi:MAG: hypothetical protein HN742_01005 [Lentisphaerae bacterium]|nr:hypothetical protein [Lentisphaerota bacterium]MBT5611202.1 hypothetical protein [Lentisphaerota bacterium]MBT7053663.1 hypothetical protein [Lentisphaerota bacterium]MBT7840411.1 hypothetical protein [Lentisphaerota bacterium]
MTSVITSIGRHPSLGTVRAYYSRDDVLTFLQRTSACRKVWFVIPSAAYWQTHGRDRVPHASVGELREFVLERINTAFPELTDDDRLPFYPSFHQSVEHWPSGDVEKGSSLGCDGVCEADLPTWGLAFRDVFTLVSILHERGVPFRLKFSGHRSLHVEALAKPLGPPASSGRPEGLCS